MRFMQQQLKKTRKGGNVLGKQKPVLEQEDNMKDNGTSFHLESLHTSPDHWFQYYLVSAAAAEHVG